jgi:hypothetical protein
LIAEGASRKIPDECDWDQWIVKIDAAGNKVFLPGSLAKRMF